MDRMKKSKTDTHTIKSRQAKTDENAAIPFDRSNGELNEYTDNDKKKGYIQSNDFVFLLFGTNR